MQLACDLAEAGKNEGKSRFAVSPSLRSAHPLTAKSRRFAFRQAGINAGHVYLPREAESLKRLDQQP